MTTTVLGEENTTTTPTAEVTTENQNATSSEIEKEGSSNSKTDEVVEETPAPPGITSTVTTELTETTQNNGEAVDKVQDESLNSIVSGQTEDVKLSSQEPASLRSKRSLTETPQTIEVEKFSVDKEKTETRVSDGSGKEKLIKNRDGNPRDIFDISRNVKVNQDGTMDVTLTVKPKQIDEGAEVIVLLDTSQKMTDDDFNTAKENITRLVTTLTSKTTNSNQNYNSRNSVRLIDFYRNVNDSINLSGKSKKEIEETIEELRKKAKLDFNGWGVNLQGAIHKAREIFNKEKKSGKRQHMVLFSQGEATISYDIKEKDKLEQNVVKEPITSSNPLLPWPFYFDYTNRRANLVEEGRKIQNLLKKLGIKRYEGILDDLANQGNSIFSFGSDIFGTNNPLDFLTMSDLDTSKQSESSFNYFKQIGEGYHHRSYYTRKIDEVPFKNVVQKIVKNELEKLKEKVESNYGWFDVLGISKLTNTISNALGINELEEKLVNKVVDYLFYKRNYIYYNHNLSAQAEAKMARDEGILFHSFDVTMPNANNRYKRSGENSEVEKRNKKFDKYLEEMSEGQKFFKDVDNADKFKDFLTEIKVTETFTDRVNVDKDSLKENNKGTDGLSVKHTPASNSSSLLSLIFSPTPAKESLTWTISKEKLKDAFEQRTPLELTYKLKVEKDKFKSASPTRAKRSLETPESNKAITEKVISGKVAYKINGNSGKETSIGDVTLTFSKELVPVPDIDEEIVIPNIPEKPLVEPEVDSILPLIPLQPLLPIYSTPELPEMEQPDQDSQEISGQSQIVDIVEDTQSGMSGQQSSSEETEITEDTRPESDNEIIVGGQSELVDIVEDTQSGMSGQHSSSEETEITEDTRPESDNEIIVGGQSELVDIVEDTQPSLSGHQSESQETVTVEDTQPNQTNILIGGQSEIVDIIEDTQVGMTGQYSSTDQLTIVEDTLPEQMEETDEIKSDSQVMDIPKVNDTNNDKGAKASVAFDVEESKVVTTQDIKPSTYVKGDNQLPQTGDDDNVNAFFTLAALSVIGAAGLRQNKRREKERN
ncbi:serum opacification factor [Streptococcus uberis]|uniref:serum opacification factor n=4 Tax=Streptococcus uberis TaxID=1349 RepID=UPI0018A6E3A9|nr:serum opacification factor [Streptococcus uberis]